jgi:Uri superfamily endonuclease
MPLQTVIPRCTGTYAIWFRCTRSFETLVGKLGSFLFPKGYWVYVGSAFGPGGLRSRLKHHLQPTARVHWHLDYVKKSMAPIEIWFTLDSLKREHAWAENFTLLEGASCPIPKFGATDCSCRAHFIHFLKKQGFVRFQSNIRHLSPDHAPCYRTVIK